MLNANSFMINCFEEIWHDFLSYDYLRNTRCLCFLVVVVLDEHRAGVYVC